MRRRFFVDRFENGRASMRGDTAHHLGRVLRAQPGQLYELSDGASVWLGRIDTVDRDRVDFSLIEQILGEAPQLHITLLFSMIKFDAFEWGLEKATELGVSRIVPLAAARSEKGLLTAAAKRAARWNKILMESAQQCRRVQLPTLHSVAKPAIAFAAASEGLRIFLSESSETPPLCSVLAGTRHSDVTLAIGPEGGWTDDERTTAQGYDFLEASLGKLILRAETAVVASLAILNFALAPAESVTHGTHS